MLGVDNGAPDNIQDFQANKIRTSRGRALLILQAEQLGEILISAKSDQVISNTAVIMVK